MEWDAQLSALVLFKRRCSPTWIIVGEYPAGKSLPWAWICQPEEHNLHVKVGCGCICKTPANGEWRADRKGFIAALMARAVIVSWLEGIFFGSFRKHQCSQLLSGMC